MCQASSPRLDYLLITNTMHQYMETADHVTSGGGAVVWIKDMIWWWFGNLNVTTRSDQGKHHMAWVLSGSELGHADKNQAGCGLSQEEVLSVTAKLPPTFRQVFAFRLWNIWFYEQLNVTTLLLGVFLNIFLLHRRECQSTKGCMFHTVCS